MTRSRRLLVKVSPGGFSSERAITVTAGENRYNLIVDEQDVQDGTLEVYLVAEEAGEAVIDLPRDTFTSGSRIRVPSEALMPV
jgi:hypothetical protein